MSLNMVIQLLKTIHPELHYEYGRIGPITPRMGRKPRTPLFQTRQRMETNGAQPTLARYMSRRRTGKHPNNTERTALIRRMAQTRPKSFAN